MVCQDGEFLEKPTISPVRKDQRLPQKTDGVMRFMWRGLPIRVQADFVTDFASVPKVLWPIFPPALGKYASILHDKLYQDKTFSRREADLVFYFALMEEGVLRWRAFAMWLGVRAFGWTAWGEDDD